MSMEIRRPHPAHYSQHFISLAGHACDESGQERPSVPRKSSVDIPAGATAEAIRYLSASLPSCLSVCYCVNKDTKKTVSISLF